MPLTLTKLTQNPLNSMTYVLVEYNRDALKSWVFNGTGEGQYTGDAPQTALSDLDLSAAANLEVPGVCSLSWPAGQLSVVDGALCWNSAGIMTLTCQKDVAVKEIIFSFPGPGQTQSLQMVFNVTVSSGTFYVNNDRINEAQWPPMRSLPWNLLTGCRLRSPTSSISRSNMWLTRSLSSCQSSSRNPENISSVMR